MNIETVKDEKRHARVEVYNNRKTLSQTMRHACTYMCIRNFGFWYMRDKSL